MTVSNPKSEQRARQSASLRIPEQSELASAALAFSLSRRHGNDFSVVVLGARQLSDEHPTILELVSEIIRRTDFIVSVDNVNSSEARLAVFCCQTHRKGAVQLLKRLRKRFGQAPGCRLTIAGLASFPRDALTLEALLELAWSSASAVESPSPFPQSAFAGHPQGNATARRITRSIPGARPRGRALKRAFDLSALLIFAPLWLPLLLSIALTIFVANPNAPILFRQRRTGRAGRRFDMYKFRTMVPNAEKLKADLAHLNELQWPDFKIDNDPRVTRLGRILRKTSLDELPQLLNVLKGDMSLVGPRPTSFAADTYEPWQTARLDVTPGLTGLWQVQARSTTEFRERLRLDIAYIDQASLWTDIKILFRTVVAVLLARGAR